MPDLCLKSRKFERIPTLSSDVPPLPIANVSADFSSPYVELFLGNRYFLHFVGCLTRWAEVFHTSETAVKHLMNNIIPRFSARLAVLTDSGPALIAKPFVETLADYPVSKLRQLVTIASPMDL